MMKRDDGVCTISPPSPPPFIVVVVVATKMSFKADAKVRAPRPIGPIDDENDDDNDDDAKKSSVRFGYALCTRARDMTI